MKAPDEPSFDEIAMVEPVAVGVYAVQLAELNQSDTIAIVGAGAIGLSVVQAAKVAGVSRIIVIEPVSERREAALKLGASEVVDPRESNPVTAIMELTGKRGTDVVFEATGAETAVEQCSKIARVLGKVVIVGIPDDDYYKFDEIGRASCRERV